MAEPSEKEIADWLLATMTLFDVELPTAHKVVGIFLEGLNYERDAAKEGKC